MNSKNRTYFLLVLLLGSMVVSFFVLRPFLTTVALAAIFAVVLYPLFKNVLRYTLGHRGLAAFFTILIGALIIMLPLGFIGGLVVDQTRTAYVSVANGDTVASAQSVANSIGVWLEPTFPGATEYAHSISLELNSYLQSALQWLIERLGAAFASILALLLRVLIFVMALYYFLKDGEKLQKSLIKRSPILDDEANAILKQLGRTITSVVKGSLSIAFIQGTLAGIGYLIFGLPNPALWGVLTGVAALIPGVGTSLVLLPAVLYLLATGGLGQALGLFLWGTLLVGLIDNVLAPRLMGKGAQLHPLLILLSVLGGVILYGPVGIFLGPLTVSFLYAVYMVYAGHPAPPGPV
jgi:predicted PurR-regulated permease PerM